MRIVHVDLFFLRAVNYIVICMRKGVRVKPATALHIKSLLNSSWDSSSTTYVDEIIDIRLMPGADADAESLVCLIYFVGIL